MLHRIVHCQCDLPRQTARGNVVESEKKYRTCDRDRSVKARRQNQDERCEPNQILRTSARRERKENEPCPSERFDERTVPSTATSPSNPNCSAHDDHFKNRHDKSLSGLKIKKRKSAKLTGAGQSNQISDSPESPIASVGKNILGEQRRKIQQWLAPQSQSSDRAGKQKGSAPIL